MVNWEIAEPKLTELQERVDEVLKMNDDFGNMRQMWEVGGELQNEELTIGEEYDLLIDQAVKPTEDKRGTWTKEDQMRLAMQKHLAQLELENKYGEDYLEDLIESEYDSIRDEMDFDDDDDENEEWWRP